MFYSTEKVKLFPPLFRFVYLTLDKGNRRSFTKSLGQGWKHWAGTEDGLRVSLVVTAKRDQERWQCQNSCREKERWGTGSRAVHPRLEFLTWLWILPPAAGRRWLHTP